MKLVRPIVIMETIVRIVKFVCTELQYNIEALSKGFVLPGFVLLKTLGVGGDIFNRQAEKK